MIRATFKDTKAGRLSLTVKGHAGAAEVGEDIICSAATILAYTVAQLVQDYQKKGMLKGDPKIILKSGSAWVSCVPLEAYHEEVKHSFFVVQTGFNLLGHNYPQYVDIEMFGGNRLVAEP